MEPDHAGFDIEPTRDERRGAFWRRALVFAVGFIAAQSAVWLILFAGAPTYTASAEIVLSPRGCAALSVRQPDVTDLPCDASGVAVASELEVIRSPITARRAAARLQRPPSDAEALLRQLSVRRAGLSHVVRISFTGRTPEAAAAGANAFADAYIEILVEARSDAAFRANAWLQQRVRESGEDVLAKERAIEAIRAESDRPADTRTLSDADSQDLTRLRELERELEASRRVYLSYLQRMQESATDAPLQYADARLVRRAGRPSAPAAPHPALVAAASIVMGGAGGAVALMIARFAGAVRRRSGAALATSAR